MARKELLSMFNYLLVLRSVECRPKVVFSFLQHIPVLSHHRQFSFSGRHAKKYLRRKVVNFVPNIDCGEPKD